MTKIMSLINDDESGNGRDGDDDVCGRWFMMTATKTTLNFLMTAIKMMAAVYNLY